jgi:hypothetical protein
MVRHKQFYVFFITDRESGQHSDSLKAGRSRDQIPLGGDIFHTHPDQPWGLPSLIYNGYRVFSRDKVTRAWH